MVDLGRFRTPDADEWFTPYVRPEPIDRRTCSQLSSPRNNVRSSLGLSTKLSSSRRAHRSTQSEDLSVRKTVNRYYATPTVCDRLVLAKPHITPHLITPPGSPEEETVSELIRAGAKRDQERERWAEYVKGTRSFGISPRVPIIGGKESERRKRHMSLKVKSHSIKRPSRDSFDDSKPSIQSAPDLTLPQTLSISDSDEVIVIDPEPSALDFSKPLPDLPIEADAADNVVMGQAISPETPVSSRLILQYDKTRTQRAFQKPRSDRTSFRLARTTGQETVAVAPPIPSDGSNVGETIYADGEGDFSPHITSEEEISDRFKGLFFRTPRDVASVPTNRPTLSFPSLTETAGLGFDESLKPGRFTRHLSPTDLSSSHDSRSAIHAIPHHTSREFRLGTPIRRPTIIATPPETANAENADVFKSPDSRYSSHSMHASAFGQVVTGPPGAGKSTYCHGMHQFLTALGRNVHVVNLDPAADPSYPCSINITEIITLDSVMEEYELGPNGAMVYVAEYLEENIDWLISRLDEVLEEDGYVIFDTPGQVELWTNHESLRRVLERLTKLDYRLVAVHLSDSHYITDASKFISVCLLALRAMMSLELPHVNVLSKIDLLAGYGELSFDLRYYAECRDLGHLLEKLETEPGVGKGRMTALNKAMVELVEEYGSVSFETLAVEDKESMLRLVRVIDKSNGYIHLPGQKLPEGVPELDHLPELHQLPDIDDVQERWGGHDEEE